MANIHYFIEMPFFTANLPASYDYNGYKIMKRDKWTALNLNI